MNSTTSSSCSPRFIRKTGGPSGDAYDLVVIMNFADNLWSALAQRRPDRGSQGNDDQGLALNLVISMPSG